MKAALIKHWWSSSGGGIPFSVTFWESINNNWESINTTWN